MKMFRLLSIITAAIALTMVTGRAENTPDNSLPADTVAQLPEMSPYEFCFSYLTVVANAFSATDSVCDIVFGHPEVMTRDLPDHDGFTAPFKASDITVDRFGPDGSKTYVWTMPEPQQGPIPLMIAFTPGKNGKYRTFYLEKSIMVPWMLGTMTFEGNSPTHSSIMPVLKTPDSSEEFAGMAERAVAREKAGDNSDADS